jgi:hypothetical protein
VADALDTMPRDVNACITCAYTSARDAHRLESRQSSQSMPHSQGLSWRCSTPSCPRPGIGSMHPHTAASIDVMTHWIVVYRRRGRANKVHNVASSQRLRRIFLGSCIINHPRCALVAKLDLPAEGNTLETQSTRPCHRSLILKTA